MEFVEILKYSTCCDKMVPTGYVLPIKWENGEMKKAGEKVTLSEAKLMKQNVIDYQI